MKLSKHWPQAVLLVSSLALALAAPQAYPGHGYVAEFFDNTRWDGEPRLVAQVREVDLSLDGNLASSRQVNYSVRYRAWLSLDRDGQYSFLLDSDDGSQLFLNDQLVVNNAGVHVRRTVEGAIWLDAGAHRLRLDYFQGVGDSILRLRWRPPGESGWSEVPLELLTPRPAGELDHSHCRQAAALRWTCFFIALFAVLAAAALWLIRGRLVIKAFFTRGGFRDLLWRPLAQDALCLLVCAAFYLPTVAVRYPHEPYMKGDSPYYANIAIGLLYHGQLDQHRQTAEDDYLRPSPAGNLDMASSNISLGARGEWYPKHSLLLPLVSLPFYAAAGGKGLLVFNLLASLLLVAAVRRAAATCCSAGAAAAAAVLTGLSPLFMHYCYSYSADVLGSLVVAAGAALLLGGRPFPAGVVFGLSAWAKLPNVLAVAAAVLAAFWLGGKRSWLRCAMGAAIVLAAHALLNWYMFGAPWLTGYSRVLVVEWGTLKTADHWSTFVRPFWDGLYWQLFDRSAGLLGIAPLSLLAVAGLLPLWRRNRSAAVLAGAFLLFSLVFYSPYQFVTGSSFGNRFLMPPLALLVVPLACLLEKTMAAGKVR